MAEEFRIDRLDFYTWAFSQPWPSAPNGKDVRELAPAHKKVPQIDLDHLDSELENELQLDADHQRQFWLWIDRAVEAIGMLEADGFDLSQRGKLFTSRYYRNHKKYSRQNAFISLVKNNLDVYKAQLSESTIQFEMVAADPAQDAVAISGVNDYASEILNANNFRAVLDRVQHDGAAYGSGVFKVHYDNLESNPDESFLEKALADNNQIDFEDFMRARRIMKAHKIEYVDTFEIITHRNASGQDSWDIDHPMHPVHHRVRQIRVSQAIRDYPEVAHKIQAATSDIYRDTNPKSFVLDTNDEDMVTLKETWIKFPVISKKEFNVRFADGQTEPHVVENPRRAVGYVARLEGVGVVDMDFDRYDHRKYEFVTWTNYPSSKHAKGIGLCKYGYAPQKVHTILFNGKLRFFERMVKGGGFFMKGLMGKDEIEARTKEHSWIEIDVNELPPELQNRPISELIYDTRPQNFPTVYDRLELQTENYVNTAMNAPPVKKGFSSGSTSGRQEMSKIQQADQVSSAGIRAIEASQLPLGEKLHSNIVQFDGERHNIEFLADDPANPSNKRVIVLNQIANEIPQYDIYSDEAEQWAKWKLIPSLIKNNIKTLRYSTRIASRSIIPTNPTERRFFFQQLLQTILPLLETKRGVVTLKWTNQFGFGGIPGFDTFIDELSAALEEDRQTQLQLAGAEQQREDQKMQAEQQFKAEELRQNLMRLRDQSQHNLRSDQIDAFSNILEFLESIAPDDGQPSGQANDFIRLLSSLGMGSGQQPPINQ